MFTIATGWAPSLIGSLFIDLDPNVTSVVDGAGVDTLFNTAPTDILINGSFSQADVTKRPIAHYNTWLDRVAVQYDGVDDYLENISGQAVLGPKITDFLVFQTNPAFGACFTGTFWADVGATTFQVPIVSPTLVRFIGGLTAALRNLMQYAFVADNAIHVYGWSYDASGSGATAYSATLDGSTQTVVDSGLAIANSTWANTDGARVDRFTHVVTSPFFGKMGRRLIFTDILSSYETHSVSNYLKRLYGI